MTTFNEFAYKRPDINHIKSNINNLIDKFDKTTSIDEQLEYIDEINKHRNQFDTMWNIASIRHSIDTKDAFYEKENNFFDTNLPEFESAVDAFYKKVINASNKTALKEKIGQQFFSLAELKMKSFDTKIMDELKLENKLKSDHTKLRSSAVINFEGEERNLSAMIPFMESTDRTLRKKAYLAFWDFFAQNEDKFDKIYDDLVKVRHKMAQKLGFKNYIEMGYARMLRTDYSAKDVERFRELVVKYIVPVAEKLRQKQAKRLGLEALEAYDMGCKYQSGNATPKGDPDWIVSNGKKMYDELSPETSTFFNFMLDRNLLDLVNKKGKAGGGYCTYIPDEKSPFIFSNFNGTAGDIDVLTHEAGHAFQVYSSMHIGLSEYNWPTYEACEIHSMSMEFFTWPWMNLFFKEDTEKYMFAHLAGALKFLPYGVAVDEFQHFVYENPTATPDERNQAWRGLEKKYLPHRNYGGHPLLEEGRFWQRQNHIFSSPFYYIDYTLAQICAFQFWKRDREDHDKAWSQYLTLCKAGGSLPFLELVELAGLKSPFEQGCIKSIIGEVKSWLDEVDDTKF